MPSAAAGCRMRTPSASPMVPLTIRTSQIAPMPLARSKAAGPEIAWPWKDATTTLLMAPTANSTRVRMSIQNPNTTSRPAQTVSRPGPCVNMVFIVPQPYSEPANRAPTTMAIAAPMGKAAPMTLLTN